MIKLIIFDWDDVFTLGATKGYYACYHKALKEINIGLPRREEIKRINAKWGKTISEEFSELLKEHPELINDAVEKYEDILMGNTFVDCLSLVKGSREIIKTLSKKYILAIASGVNPKLLKEKIFNKFSIPNVFGEIITVYDLEDPTKAKPHPFILQEIMRRQNILPQETIMVGDAKGDVAMAKSAGITPVVVLTGHLNRKEAKELGVKFVIPDVTFIQKILDKFDSIK